MFMRSLCLMLSLLLLCNCTTLHTVHNPSKHSTLIEKLDIGDVVSVDTQDGSKVVIQLTEMNQESITGYYPPDNQVTSDQKESSKREFKTIQIADINHMEVERIDVIKSIGAGAAGLVVATVLLVISVALNPPAQTVP